MTASRLFKALIVDDEPPARTTLRILLGTCARIEIVGECGDAPSAIAAIRELKPDVMFIDVQMPGATGIDVVQEAGLDVVPVIVFTTAYAEYTLPAFEVHALDYLLKPFSDERFQSVISRVLRALDQARPAALARTPRSLAIRDAGRTYVIPVADIDWVEAEDYCTRIHAGARSVLIRRSLQSLQAELEPDGFQRIHRSSLVNLAKVREVRSVASGDAEVLLADGTRLRLSRNARAAFESHLRTTAR